MQIRTTNFLGEAKAMSETDFKVWFREQFKGWSEAYEPRRGSGTGMPDIQILLDGLLLPIELKLGEIKNGRVFADEFQPAQVSWHYRFNQAGGVAIFIVGVSLYDNILGKQVWHPVKLPKVTLDMLFRRDEGWDLKECEPWTRWLP